MSDLRADLLAWISEREKIVPHQAYHCSGQHHGDGHQFCPRELHHHHDETCIAGYRDEILQLRIEIDRLRAGSGEGRELREALEVGRVTIPTPDFLEWVAARCMRFEGLDPKGCVELDYAVRLRALASALRRALRQGDASERAKKRPEHVCGLTGYRPWPPYNDPPCPGCQGDAEGRK